MQNYGRLGGIQNANYILLQTRNTKYKTIANKVEYKIQNYCKLGGIQNSKYKTMVWNTKYKNIES